MSRHPSRREDVRELLRLAAELAVFVAFVVVVVAALALYGPGEP